MPDDHSKLVPLLPIPNRTVKRLCADDSADPCVKVGHRQAVIPGSPVSAAEVEVGLAFCLWCGAWCAAVLGREALPKGSEENFSDFFDKTLESVS